MESVASKPLFALNFKYFHNCLKAVVKLKPFRPESFFTQNFITAQVVCVTAMINHNFISFSAVLIHDISYIHLQQSILKSNLMFKRKGLVIIFALTHSRLPYYSFFR